MAETPEFEFTLPAGVMGALEEAARQFQGASADDGVASVRVAQAFALAAPVLADISAALAQIEDVYLRHELSHQATQLLDLVSSGNVSGIGNIAAQAARLMQQAMQQNSLNQSRLPTKEEKLNALWAAYEEKAKAVDEDIAFFKARGYTVDEEDEEKLRKNKERMEEIKRTDPNWRTNPEYVQLAKENVETYQRIDSGISEQMQARGGGTEEEKSRYEEMAENQQDLNDAYDQMGLELEPPSKDTAKETTHEPTPILSSTVSDLGALPTQLTAHGTLIGDKNQSPWL